MSWSAKGSWKPETPGSEPAGARISAGKSGYVARSLPVSAVSEVKRPPVSCIPSPESPAKRMMTRSSCSTGLDIGPGELSLGIARIRRSGALDPAPAPRGALLLGLEPQLGNSVNDEIAHHQEDREQHRHADEAGVSGGIAERRRDHVRKVARAEDRVPAVQADEAPEVDPEGDERERRDEEDPRHGAAEPPPRDRVDEQERPDREREPGPSTGAEHDRVVPERNPRVGVRVQVDEVGQQVRRVGQEEQPRRGEDAQQEPRPSPAVGVVEREREHERQPREEQVPEEVLVVLRAAPVHARDDERGAERGRERQRGERGQAAAAHPGHQRAAKWAFSAYRFPSTERTCCITCPRHVPPANGWAALKTILTPRASDAYASPTG